MRTPEETARLANGVTVETPSGAGTITPKVIEWGERRILSHAVMPGIDKEEALVCLAADLAEARAEVAASKADAAGWEHQMDMAVQRADQLSAEVGMLEAEVAALREDRDRFAMLRCCEMDGAMVTALGINPPGEDAVANWRAVCDAAEQMAEVAGLVREWQAAMAERSRTFEAATDTIDPGAMAEHEAAEVAVEDIEARLLAATLPEVSRG